MIFINKDIVKLEKNLSGLPLLWISEKIPKLELQRRLIHNLWCIKSRFSLLIIIQ